MIRRFHPAGPLHRAFTAACGLLAGAALVSAAPGHAQQRSGPTDDDGAEPVATTSVPVVQSVTPSPTRMLNSALSRLARDPRDISALLDAGGAALDLGDTDAAIGFLTRAEQVAPGTAGVRARMGVAMLRSNQPIEALRWFDLAEQAGFSRTEMATERGLAYDLVGDNTAAQRQYQLALTLGKNDEASRRYALSLVIGGDRRGAELVIQPLLERQDRGAWRVRTFIMAIGGQSDEAEGIARATMPADLAAAIAPYLRYMPRLTPAQQAAAANLGRFPRAADIGRDDPQVVQYALAHPRAPRVDAALVPQGDALGARGRDDRSKRRRPGKDDKRQTAVAVAAPVQAPVSAAPAPSQPAVTAPWGLQPGTRTAAAPSQPLSQSSAQPLAQPQPQPARPVVLSKLDVPPGTPLAPPAPVPAVSAAAPPSPSPAATTQLALTAPPPAAAVSQPVIQPVPAATPPVAPPTTPATTAAVSPSPDAAAPAPDAAPAAVPAPPADFGSAFDGFKPPEQEAEATADAVDLARIEALREAARASRAKARDRGERPDGPTSVSRTSDQDAAEPAVTRPGKDKGASEKAGKDKKDKAGKDKAEKDKLALAADCLDATGKGKGKSAKGKASGKGKPAAPAKGKAGTRAGKGKGAADAQCPPESDKPQKGKGKGKAEPQYASRIWVQVLTGSNRAAIGKEWQGLQARAALLRSRKPFITPWRSNYRLLTGPFASDAEAQAFIEKLRASGVSSYEWTSPAGQAVDGLGVK